MCNAKFWEGVKAGQFAREDARKRPLSERTTGDILTAVIADLAAMPARSFHNEAVHQRVIADLNHLRGRLDQ